MPRWLLGACLGVLAYTGSLSATTVVPLTFDEIVTRADVIFVGEVIDVRPFRLNTRDGSIIKTRVVFRVDQSWSGDVGLLETFDILGGEVDGEIMAVAEMPRFSPGDRRVVFARRERSINPIVGFGQGLFRVTRDLAGVERVATLDGTPLREVASLGRTANTRPVSAVAVTLRQLRSEVVRVRSARRQ